MRNDEIEQIRNGGYLQNVPLFGQWQTFVEYQGVLWMFEHGRKEPRKLTGSAEDDARWYIRDYNDNRLKYFLPHGQQGDAINDWTNGIVMLTAPTRTGKSACGPGFLGFRGIPCDPEWECFTKNGIDFHEWRGPRIQVVSSYAWTNVETVWQEYQKFIPREELGQYAIDWGEREGEHGRGKVLSFTGRSQRAKLKCGTELQFLCDGQKQGAWEGKRFDDHHVDEQRVEEKFIGYLRGTGNTLGLVQSIMTLTGHVLPDRPDTGASGWVKRKLYDGTYTFGKTVSRYKISIPDVPDVIMPPERKEELRRQWVTEPTRNRDIEMLRKAEARYWGGWEPGSGSVIDNFDPATHKIPPYDRSHKIFTATTKYRGIDHGLGRPCAAALVEVFPWGDMVMYDEYYEVGHTVPYHAKHIVEWCGNERRETEAYYDDMDIVAPVPILEEEFCGTKFLESVLDGRSFKSPAQERSCNLGDLYNDCGLFCLPAKGTHNIPTTQNEGMIQHIKKNLAIISDRPHIMYQFLKHGIVSSEAYNKWLESRKGDYMNGSILYFIDSLHFVFSEIYAWEINPKTNKPKDADNHIIGGALKYIIAEEPQYFGPSVRGEYGGSTLREVDDDNPAEREAQFKYV